LSNKKIDIIVGARPNFIKAFPVYRALEKTGSIRLKLINTGQHYDKNMSALFFDQMQMKEPDINLGIGSGNHGEQTGRILIELEKVFINDRPDLVIVFGDVNSTFAAALAAKKLCIAVAHIEAGLRSFDRNMPEEINRLLTDQISDYLFITSKEAKNNLLNEGKIVEQIHFVGNTMIDSLLQFNNKFNCEVLLNKYKIENGTYCLITLHRPSNVDNKLVLSKIIETINNISYKFQCIWPIHPRTRKNLDRFSLNINKNIHITDPIGYFEFMGLQKNANFIITDSGGVQEESTFFGVPCFTFRENTERPVTIAEGTNQLVDPTISSGELSSLLKYKKNGLIPKLWDGKSSERIAKIIQGVRY